MDAASPRDPGPSSAAAGPVMTLRVTALRWAAPGIHLVELQRPEGGLLPPFSAGAHIDLHLPGGLVRAYSLCSPPGASTSWEIAVKHEAAGRGGSRHVHEQLRPGQLLPVGGPRNQFPLDERAAHSVLFAGGIGITPIACMAQRLATIGASFEVHVAVRRREEAALLDRIPAQALHLHVDAEHGGAPLPLTSLVSAAQADAHLYCCGPAPMLAAFEAATAGWPRAQVHLERFSAPPGEAPAAGGGFTVQLARSGRSLPVAPGQTLLQVLQSAGVPVITSCEQGICGSCETRVISGRPDHRDHLLSEDEKASHRVMMVCCSGSQDPLLVLDL